MDTRIRELALQIAYDAVQSLDAALEEAAPDNPMVVRGRMVAAFYTGCVAERARHLIDAFEQVDGGGPLAEEVSTLWSDCLNAMAFTYAAGFDEAQRGFRPVDQIAPQDLWPHPTRGALAEI